MNTANDDLCDAVGKQPAGTQGQRVQFLLRNKSLQVFILGLSL